ncbi:solute carrier family 22 member 15-like [Elysia marginata]|uniref:Solute carrier family 22 member 15-like n=1 Tax=Elysia marginata TaxID=1093978 RepID=A0AAV4FIA3_9GAST|nr:solute carrier family 22 member 15-like [Elysia marginata]
MASLDSVLDDIGACGPFQGLLVLAVYSTLLSSIWGIMMLAFGFYNPGWVCLDGMSMGNWSESKLLSTDLNSSSNATEELNSADHCTLYSTCTNVSFSSETSSVASEWGLVCDRAWALKVIFTVQFAGIILGAYLTGQISELVGPKASLYGMVALNGVANLVAVFSQSWEAFAAIRFFIGMASGGIMLPAYVTPLEFTGKFWRGVVGSFPAWNIGAVLFAAAVILLKDWRYLHILGAFLSGLVFLPVFWVPQSFRWLAVHGRDKNATAVVTKIAKMNGRPKPSLEILVKMAECERRRALVKGRNRYSYLDLFRETMLRKTVIIMSFVWVSLGIVYYGISFSVQALSGDFYINFLILTVMEMPSPIFSLPTVTYITRRWGSAIHLLVVSMACFGITITSLVAGNNAHDEDSQNEDLTKVKINVGLASIAKVGTISAFAVVTIFCSELFPTAVRNLGFGFLNFTTRLGSFIGPLLFPQDPALLYLAMIVSGVLTLVSAVLLLLLPETKGAPLEDVLRSKTLHLRIDITAPTKNQNGTDTLRKEIDTDREVLEVDDCESALD